MSIFYSLFRDDYSIPKYYLIFHFEGGKTMTAISNTEMRSVSGGKTYSYTVKCEFCGASFTGKASGISLLAPIWKYNARNKAYNKYYAHIAANHS